MARKVKTPISNQLRNKILKRDGYRCRYCGSLDGPFEIDHVYPESKGGETTVANLVTSCKSCNQSKMTKVGLWPKPIGYFRGKPPETREPLRYRKNPARFDALSLFVMLFACAPLVLLVLSYMGYLVGLLPPNPELWRNFVIVFLLIVAISMGMFIQMKLRRVS